MCEYRMMMKIIVLHLCLLAGALASNILMLTLGGTKSHKTAFLALGQGLRSQGHEVTLVSAFPPSAPSPVEEVAPLNLVLYVRNFTKWDLLGRRVRNQTPVPPLDVLKYSYQVCEAFYSSEETRDLLSRRVDLLILDGAYPDCLLGLVHHYSVPFVYLNTIAFFTFYLSLAGNPTMYSVTPSMEYAHSDRMNFWEKAHTALYHVVVSGLHLISTKVLVEPVVRQHLGTSVPSLYSMGKNVSLILQHGHHSITYPRPYLPNVVEVACLHCHPARPLPKDLEDFVTGGRRRGFVFVSFGTSVKDIPEDIRLMMVSVFKLLPYQILWRYEEDPENLPDLPKNVRLGRWLPQQDLLGHPNILAFISHVGLHSLMEAVYHAVPMVTLPVFCDQVANSHKAVVDGYALTLDLREATGDSFLATVNKVITDKSFKANAVNRSILLKDRPEEPVDTAIYWIEYVLRHQGALHLQGAAKDLTLVQYFMLDTISALLLLLYVVLKVFTLLVRIFRRKPKTSTVTIKYKNN